MKGTSHTATLFTALALFAAAAAPSRAALTISEVMSSSGTGGTPDWFELTNTGPGILSLAGYQIDDSSASFATSFPLLGVASLNPGESAVFIESAAPTTDVPAFRTFWGGAALLTSIGSYSGGGLGLSSAGDGVTIFDPTQTIVAQVTFGAATTGTSFDNTSGTPTLSVAGVNRAYNSASTAPANIGSPGVVPEPSTFAFIGVAATALAFALRRRVA